MMPGELIRCSAEWQWTKKGSTENFVSMLNINIHTTFKALSIPATTYSYIVNFNCPVNNRFMLHSHDSLIDTLNSVNLFHRGGAEFVIRKIQDLWRDRSYGIPYLGWDSRMDVSVDILVEEINSNHSTVNGNIYYYDSESEDEIMSVNEQDWEVGFVAASKEVIESLDKIRVSDEICNNMACPVCLEDILMGSEAIRLPCWHFFHQDCIVRSLNVSKFCTLCRYDLLGESNRFY